MCEGPSSFFMFKRHNEKTSKWVAQAMALHDFLREGGGTVERIVMVSFVTAMGGWLNMLKSDMCINKSILSAPFPASSAVLAAPRVGNDIRSEES